MISFWPGPYLRMVLEYGRIGGSVDIVDETCNGDEAWFNRSFSSPILPEVTECFEYKKTRITPEKATGWVVTSVVMLWR